MREVLLKFIAHHPTINRTADFLYRVSEGNFFVRNCRDFTQSSLIRGLIKLVVTPFSLLRYYLPIRTHFPEREGIALVLIAKNEAPYIKEWLDFHLKQGVSHFIIYDNESTDNFQEVLQP